MQELVSVEVDQMLRTVRYPYLGFPGNGCQPSTELILGKEGGEENGFGWTPDQVVLKSADTRLVHRSRAVDGFNQEQKILLLAIGHYVGQFGKTT